MRKKILVVISESAEFHCAIKIVEIMRAGDMEYDYVFFFSHSYHPRMASFIDDCVRNDIYFVIGDAQKLEVFGEIDTEKGYIPRSISRKKISEYLKINFIYSILEKIIPMFVMVYLYYIQKFFQGEKKQKSRKSVKNQYKTLKKRFLIFLKKGKPKLVVCLQNYPGSFSSIFIEMSKMLSIPSVVVPYAISKTKEINESLYYGNSFSTFFSKVVSRKYPKWINLYKDKYILRLDPVHIYYLEKEKLNTEIPFLPNSGKSVCLLRNKSDYEYYNSAGIDKKNLIITGGIFDDQIKKNSDEKRQEDFRRIVLDNYNIFLKPKKRAVKKINPKIIIFAWPTDQFSRPAPNEYESYAELCSTLCLMLKKMQDQYNCLFVISVHPTQTKIKVNDQFLSDYFFIYSQSIKNIINFGDIIAVSNSSILIDAIFVGKPVINYDPYSYNYIDMEHEPAIRTARNVSDFRIALLSMLDEKLCNESEESVKELQELWGFYKGSADEKIREELYKMIA